MSGREAQSGKWIEGLTAATPLSTALEKIFRQRCRAALRALSRASHHAEDDIEHIHQVRVSSRRLGAVLDVFAEWFPETARGRLQALVEEIRQCCGDARDLDVQILFLETLEPTAPAKQAAALCRLREVSVAHRARLQKKLRKKLPKLGWELHEAADGLFRTFRRRREKHDEAAPSFGETATHLLTRELAGLWTWSASELDQPEQLHPLRIACKHLRYTIEMFIPALHESFQEEFYPQLEHIQNVLGKLHDALAASEALVEQRKKWKQNRDRKKAGLYSLGDLKWKQMRGAIDTVLHAYAKRAKRAHASFLELWPVFAGASFRLPVEEMLELEAREQRRSPGLEQSRESEHDSPAAAQMQAGADLALTEPRGDLL